VLAGRGEQRELKLVRVHVQLHLGVPGHAAAHGHVNLEEREEEKRDGKE
jgi:hypothetical protein